MNYNLITLLGPTAVGKTKLAAELAYHFNGEIISADSRQVYVGMDIGTGKDLDDYIINNVQVPHHLIDVISPKHEFDLYKYTKLFKSAYNDITARKKTPFLVGGTGLYLHSILTNYKLVDVDFSSNRAKELLRMNEDELRKVLLELKSGLHNTTDLIDKERIMKAILISESRSAVDNSEKRINSLTIGVKLDRDLIKQRITHRLKERLASGMIDEVKSLVRNGVTHDKLKFFGLEYKYVSQFLQGSLSYNDMYQKLNSAIHNFAKRQMTWFRKMEREGINIHWINGADFNQAKTLIKKEYSGS
ncbi:trna dimethylallyltransferase [hydrocarbon metagenome]|uniref:tRNA dimethylallyltransferase n=1 Tax=hydrocarbon metagenome TaxID=938273 RepID=A0A0W8FWP2_9ZZZZ